MKTAMLFAAAIALTAIITTHMVRVGTECGQCPSVAEADQQRDLVSGMLERCDYQRQDCINERRKLQTQLASCADDARDDEREKMARTNNGRKAR